MDIGIWEIIGGIGASSLTGFGAGVLKDIITKNNLKNKITDYDEFKKSQTELMNEVQTNIQDVQKDIIGIKRDVESNLTNINKFEKNQREEISEINQTLKENTKAIIQLESTLKTISDFIINSIKK